MNFPIFKLYKENLVAGSEEELGFALLLATCVATIFNSNIRVVELSSPATEQVYKSLDDLMVPFSQVNSGFFVVS